MKCPKCKSEIKELNFDITSTCKSNIYSENIKDESWGKDCLEAYDSDSLLGNVEFDNFACPECDEILFQTEEQAIKFLKGEK